MNASLTIRGISQSDFSPIQESPNSMYIDDVYLSSPNMAAFSMYDLAQVEVLRGPQGTLFGRASSGGLVNFLTQRPTKDFQGFAEAGYGSFNDRYVEAAVGGPISDRVRFRLAGRSERADGWLLNGAPGGQAAFEKKFNGIRGQIEADLTENLTARIALSYDANPSHREGAYINQASQWDFVTGHAPSFGNELLAIDPIKTYPQWNKADFHNIGYLSNYRFSPTLYLTYNFGDAKISSITNYTKFAAHYLEDCAGGFGTLYCYDTSNPTVKQFSQELRLNGKSGDVTYTAGLYYLNIDLAIDQVFGAPTYGFFDTNPITQKTDNYAVFGQLEYQATPQLRLTIGGRLTREIKTFDSKLSFSEDGVTYGAPSYDFSPATVGGLARHSETLPSGKIQIDYKPNRDLLLYANVSRGVKAAGFNSGLSGAITVEQTPFRSEFANVFEAGEKLQLFGNKMRLNGSVFYYDYHHFQGFSFLGTSSVVGNYNGYFVGGELEAAAAPTKDLDINLGVSYLKSKLNGFTSGYLGSNLSEQSINAPHWTVDGNITKRFELPFGTLSLTWAGNYLGSRYASLDNNPMTFLPASFMHNARDTLSLKDKGLDLSFFVNNISNTARKTFAQDETTFFGYDAFTYSPPRWFGGSIRKSF